MSSELSNHAVFIYLNTPVYDPPNCLYRKENGRYIQTGQDRDLTVEIHEAVALGYWNRVAVSVFNMFNGVILASQTMAPPAVK